MDAGRGSDGLCGIEVCREETTDAVLDFLEQMNRLIPWERSGPFCPRVGMLQRSLRTVVLRPQRFRDEKSLLQSSVRLDDSWS